MMTKVLGTRDLLQKETEQMPRKSRHHRLSCLQVSDKPMVTLKTHINHRYKIEIHERMLGVRHRQMKPRCQVTPPSIQSLPFSLSPALSIQKTTFPRLHCSKMGAILGHEVRLISMDVV